MDQSTGHTDVARELRQMLQDTLERIAKLNAERGALEGARDDLWAQLSGLRARRAEAQRRHDCAAERAAERAQRADEIDAQMRATQREIPLLERRRAAAAASAERLARESAAMGHRLSTTRERIVTARTALASGQQALARLCDKLARHGVLRQHDALIASDSLGSDGAAGGTRAKGVIDG